VSLKMTKPLMLLLIGLRSIQAATTAPKLYPEVVPGPGLPTLAELNITSAQLYEMGPPVLKAHVLAGMATAYQPTCGPSDAAYANEDDIIACFHYLDSLGTTRCVATRGMEGNRMCKAGGAQVVGLSLANTQSSSCWHVHASCCSRSVDLLGQILTRVQFRCGSCRALDHQFLHASGPELRW
jgi:hypothetical protein